jgi:ABC-type lipoprotein export system ATPase subunit
MEVLRKLNQELGMTIAFVTHGAVVAGYTRRIVSLRDGEIVSDVPNTPSYERVEAQVTELVTP